MSLPQSKLSIRNLFPLTKIDGMPIGDFWNAYQVTNEFKSQTENFDTYLLGDGERWDLIAGQMYNDRSLWWTIAIFNDVEDPFSIYFDMDIDSSLKKIRLMRPESLIIFLNEVRDRAVKLETKRLNTEEKERRDQERSGIR